MDYKPPSYDSPQFNTSLFDTGSSEFLTIAQGDYKYLKISGSTASGIINFDAGLSASYIDLESANSTPLIATSLTSAYGLQLVTKLSGVNGVRKGSSIAFSSDTADVVPYANIYLDKKSSTTGDLVFGCRQTATDCNENFRIRSDGSVRAVKCLQVGTSTDTSRMISCLDTAMTAGTSRFITIGQGQSSRNQAEISFYYAGSGLDTNRIDFGFFGGASFYMTAQGYFGIGTSAPSCALDINTSNSVQIASSGSAYTFDIQTASSSISASPFSATICARFRSSVWIQNKIYVQSDRRVKRDINDLDFTLSHYNKLRPVSYKLKRDRTNGDTNGDDEKVHLGLIAQEVMDVCGQAIEYHPDETMKIEDDKHDMAGVIYSVDYNAVNMMNVVAIKKLIEKVNILEDIINSLRKNESD